MAVWASANVSTPVLTCIIAGASLGLLLIFAILTGERINAIFGFSTLSCDVVVELSANEILFVGGSGLVEVISHFHDRIFDNEIHVFIG